MNLLDEFKKGSKRAIGRLISEVENKTEIGLQIMKQLGDLPEKSVVVGITGPPGAGKSTLIYQLTKKMISQGSTVGIIAVDPSSPLSGGALLGDRIRMSELSGENNVFIRSMASRGSLGGISEAVYGAVEVLKHCKMDYILIETVGVGQSEVEIRNLADFVIFVTVPGLGDDIQAEKAGVLEIADLIVLNKADREDADHALRYLENSVRLSEDYDSESYVSVLSAVAVKDQGIDEILNKIKEGKHFNET
ncbi:methylmalonyl Co-A mutase-associated GTPase MeaB [Sinanaerobacter chloroacetimidivorans]|uniref:Methylmalonyl Co-A mutase-associated GTPase MeaB n=1 Tax=Sinanaerobacter chloroacetimidivorans TaxID=2818044 RepID=A0A8J7W0Y8_9FIRM|nr:methylmalonyl Co-A mutase-associated GTPase MeaB [Sinanaerobacter chloroacetimidivorans]MBR0596945.1 methylmalonyl Co-A mutase-associated GTPase MeaB [Sinanaerobacter chloroacetimidivorans]